MPRPHKKKKSAQPLVKNDRLQLHVEIAAESRHLLLTRDEAAAVYHQLEKSWFPDSAYDTLHALMLRLRKFLNIT
jgi:hypothetical protein